MNRQTLKVISFNMNGILNPAKRRQILTKMKRENVQIVLLQETHWSMKNLKECVFQGSTIHLINQATGEV